ncbi:MAG: polymer-forming cytoskeletal protein [Pseudomonadota bacterium]|nr:polymer-forming cytoskeletal protein [Pseudomonadota bacterium]MDQ3160215.1 polymer-forming cytoskeletal protein [Pseudomonadota bacterium]
MNHLAWLALLVAANVALLLLPMLPALREWRRPPPKPLFIPEDDEAGIEYFAASFRQRLATDWNNDPFFLASPPASADTGLLVLPADSTASMVVPTAHVGEYRIARAGTLIDGPNASGRALEPVLIGDAIEIAGGKDYLGDIYARSSLRGSGQNIIRAALCDGDIALGPGSGILRWAHAHNLYIGNGSRIPGRISALSSITLGTGCRFVRVKAPAIDLGPQGTWPSSAPSNGVDPRPLRADAEDQLPTASDGMHWHRDTARWTSDGDIELPAGSVLTGDLIVRGNVTLGAACTIQGSIKSYRDVIMGIGTVIEGSCFARGKIVLKQSSRVFGQLSSIMAITCEDGCTVGRPGRPASTIAPDITIIGTCRFHGSLWARNSGRILPA